jgi:molybdenum cofactor guanylyltransferase
MNYRFMQTNLTGIVLSGGRSSRMGEDKGLLQSGNGLWAGMTEKMMQSVTDHVRISVNPDQLDHYLKQFSGNQILVDDQTLEIKGPLTGLITAHELFSSDDIMVLPCDLPNMSVEVLRSLRNIYEHNSNFEAWVFKNGDQIEPVCGIYSKNALARILAAIKNKSLGRFSMHHALELLKVYFIPVEDEWKFCFENFNTHSDLDRLK